MIVKEYISKFPLSVLEKEFSFKLDDCGVTIVKPTNGRDCFSAPLVASILHLIKKQAFLLGMLLKNWFILSAVRISSYGCTWEVWRALKKLELLSALTLLSCSPNLPHASITRYTHAKYEPILKFHF